MESWKMLKAIHEFFIHSLLFLTDKIQESCGVMSRQILEKELEIKIAQCNKTTLHIGEYLLGSYIDPMDILEIQSFGNLVFIKIAGGFENHNSWYLIGHFYESLDPNVRSQIRLNEYILGSIGDDCNSWIDVDVIVDLDLETKNGDYTNPRFDLLFDDENQELCKTIASEINSFYQELCERGYIKTKK